MPAPNAKAGGADDRDLFSAFCFGTALSATAEGGGAESSAESQAESPAESPAELAADLGAAAFPGTSAEMEGLLEDALVQEPFEEVGLAAVLFCVSC